MASGGAGNPQIPNTNSMLRADYDEMQKQLNQLNQLYSDLLALKGRLDARVAPIVESAATNNIWRGKGAALFAQMWTEMDEFWDPQVEQRLEAILNILPQVIQTIQTSDDQSSALFGDMLMV